MVDNLNLIREWKVPKRLTGNCFIFGRIDSGKSWKLVTLAYAYIPLNYKLFEMYGGKRNENSFCCFPSEEKKLWREFEDEVGPMKNNGPKKYYVDLLYFIFSSKLPKKLPEFLPRIKCKKVTIPFRTITLTHISLIIGDVSSNAKYVWNYIIKHTNKNSNAGDIDFLMNTKLRRYKDLSIYKLFIRPLIDNHLLSSEVSPTNIDLIEEAKNKDVISVLCHEYIPDEFRYFIMGYMLTSIMKLAMDDKIPKQNIGLFREASKFMKVQDKNLAGAEQTQIFRNLISDTARYARSGLFLFMDTQSPFEVKGLIEGQDDLLGINEMPSMRDREEVCKQLKQDRRISDAQIRYIATIPIHQMVIITRGQKAKLIKRIAPPRISCWKQGQGNFISTWKRRVDKWTTTSEEIRLIDEGNKNHYAKIEQELKEKVMKEVGKIQEKPVSSPTSKISKLKEELLEIQEEKERVKKMLESPIQV